jgi:hypothetical protein
MSTRPRSNFAQWVSAACAVVTVGIAGFGVYSIDAQLKHLATQREEINYRLEREEQRKVEELLSRLTALDNELNRVLLDWPHLRPIFVNDRDGKKCGEAVRADAANKERIKVLCSMYCNMFDYFFHLQNRLKDQKLERAAMAASAVYEDWRAYLESLYARSFIFREFVKEMGPAYGLSFREEIDRCLANENAVLATHANPSDLEAAFQRASVEGKPKQK